MVRRDATAALPRPGRRRSYDATMSDDPRTFPETAQQLAALVEHAVTMHESHGWAGPEHSTVDCAMWAVGQYQAVHGDTLTAETVTAAIACTASMRALVAAEAEAAGTPEAEGAVDADDDADPSDADAASSVEDPPGDEHAEHADEVFALLLGFLQETGEP